MERFWRRSMAFCCTTVQYCCFNRTWKDWVTVADVKWRTNLCQQLKPKVFWTLLKYITFGDSIYREVKISHSVRKYSRGYLHNLVLEHSGKAQIRKLATLHGGYGKTNFFQRQFGALGLGSCPELASREAHLCLCCLGGKLGKASQIQLAEERLVSAPLRLFFAICSEEVNLHLRTCVLFHIQYNVSGWGFPSHSDAGRVVLLLRRVQLQWA